MYKILKTILQRIYYFSIYDNISLISRKFKSKNFKLDNNLQNLLDLMRIDNLNSSEPFQASILWKTIVKDFDHILTREGATNLSRFNTMFSHSNINSTRYYRYALYMLYKKIKERDVYKILDKIKVFQINEGSLFVFDGH
jgi:hypothetical protein